MMTDINVSLWMLQAPVAIKKVYCLNCIRVYVTTYLFSFSYLFLIHSSTSWEKNWESL